MRPAYQPLNFSGRNYADKPATPNSYTRSPHQRGATFQQSHSSPSQLFYNPTEGSKKISTSIKALGDKIQGVQAIMRRNSGKFDKMPNFKTDAKEIGGHQPPSRPGDLHLRKEESEPDLRTSCPNVFKKFEQTSLRNTMHTNHSSKFSNIMAQVKKYDEKNGADHPNSPGTRVESARFDPSGFLPSTSFKKINSEKVPFKVRTEIRAQPTREGNTGIQGFSISKQLGKGKFGQVYLARHIQTGFIVALKKIVKSKLIQYKMVEQFKRQIRLHSALDHPNIVKFYGFFEDGDNIYLILEYVSGGTLFDYLAEKDMLESKEAAEYLRDTIEALTYMHDKSIAHRDIKPENIVLTAEKVAKLCDFGWSALVESSRTTYCGTFDYAPPEILERKNYDTAVDIWCIGVLTYEILTGRVPFQGDKRKQVMQKILSVDKNKIYYPVAVPEDAKNFIELLVQKDPSLRPKSRQLLSHPFFKNNLKPTAKKL